MGSAASSYLENTYFTETSNSFFTLYCEKHPSKFVCYKILRIAYDQHLHRHGISLPTLEFNRIFIKILQEQGGLVYGEPTVVVGLHLHTWVKQHSLVEY